MPRTLALPFVCLLSIALAGVAGPLLAQQKAPKPLEVSINDGQIDINRVRPTIPGPRRELELALGEPDRVTPEDSFFMDGHVLKWDQQGLYGLQVYKKTTMSGVGIILWQKDDKNKTTQEVFSGKLTIDRATVTAESTIEQINKDKRGAPFTKIDPDLYTLELGKVHVRLRLNKPGVAPKGVNISRVILSVADED